MRVPGNPRLTLVPVRAALILTVVLAWAAGAASAAEPSSGEARQTADQEPEVVVEGGTEVVRPPPEKPLPSQANQPGSRIVITRDQFQESQKTVADVVSDQPGVTLTRSGDLLAPAKITLRGSRTDQVLVIIDGVPQNTQTDNPADGRLTGRQGVDLSQLDLTDVESIEIVRGAASGMYGPDAAGGAIVIHTRRPRQRELTVDHAVGTGGYVDSGVSGAEPVGASTLTYNARDRVSDGHYVYFDPDAQQSIGGAPDPCAKSLGGGYFERGCDKTEITTAGVALLQGAQRRIALDWEYYDRHGLGGVASPEPFGRERDTRVGLNYLDGYAASGGDGFNWRLTAVELDGHRTDNEEVSSGVLENHHVEESRQGELWWIPAWGNSAAQTPTPGPALAQEAPSPTGPPRAAGDGTPSPTAAAPSTPGVQPPASQPPGSQVRLGAGASRLTLLDEFFTAQRDQGWLTGLWTQRHDSGAIEASVRADGYSDVEGQATWHLAVTQRLLGGSDSGPPGTIGGAPQGGSFGVKASAGTGYRPPTLYELYDPGSTLGPSAANPHLKPESSQSVDGGVYLDWPDRFYGELIAFEQDFHNSIEAIVSPASPEQPQFQNLTRTRSTGYEALATWKPTRGLTLSLNYTYTRAELLDEDDPRNNGNQVPGVPLERGAVELAWRRERWSLYVKGRASSARFADDENTIVLKPYTVWDAGVAVPLPYSFEVTLDARNLTNETYSEVDNFPAPGLQIFLTLRWRLHPSGTSSAPPAAPAPGTPMQSPRAAEPTPLAEPSHTEQPVPSAEPNRTAEPALPAQPSPTPEPGAATPPGAVPAVPPQ